MGFADSYFSKQKGFIALFDESPSPNLRFVVVIPAYLEPDLITSLESLVKCRPPEGHVEVIVVNNMPENASREVIGLNDEIADKTAAWINKHSTNEFHFLLIKSLKMPEKEAGVGFARKTGMDQALYRFNHNDYPAGIILSFDADSRCDPDYFTAIEDTIFKYPLLNGFNIYYEHPVTGYEFPKVVYRAIVEYEMHLRYLNLFIRFTGFPHAYHTVGSCFGVRAATYAREGGMNKKKAGEDFYFLHKIIPLGEFHEINSTRVIPSPRESGRVPFGTGAAIRKYIEPGKQCIFTYSPACFHDLKSFFRTSGDFYRMDPDQIVTTISCLPESIKNYLSDIHALDSIIEINANSGSRESFANRFFRWFDAFRVIKYLNYAGRTYYEKVDVRQAVTEYLKESGISFPSGIPDNPDLLHILREMERTRR